MSFKDHKTTTTTRTSPSVIFQTSISSRIEAMFVYVANKLKKASQLIGEIFDGPPNEERQEMHINPYMIGRQRESFWE